MTQLPETKPKSSERSKTQYRRVVGDLLRDRGFLSIAIVGFLIWFFRRTLQTYVTIYAKVELNKRFRKEHFQLLGITEFSPAFHEAITLHTDKSQQIKVFLK